MLLRGQVEYVGVFPPEVFNQREREIFYQGINAWNITVNKQTEAAG